MDTDRFLLLPALSLATLTLAFASGAPAAPCVAPDNGAGTATLPIAGCVYEGDVLRITDGLPPGTTIDMASPIFGGWSNASETTGGPLSGNVQQYGAHLLLQMAGTGTLAGFSRSIDLLLPDDGTNHMASGPRTPNASPQTFDIEVLGLRGQANPADPDFGLLRIVGGSDSGMYSPGTTQLTSDGAGHWTADSFFDLTYRIDFIGAPGGALAGRSGSTNGVAHFVLRAVPEPSTLLLTAFGACALGGVRRRRRSTRAPARRARG
jgi:hypothetical protein